MHQVVSLALLLAAFSGSIVMGCKTSNMGSSATAGVQGAAVSCEQEKLVSLVRAFNHDAWQYSTLAKAQQVAAMKAGNAEFYRVTPYVFYALVRQHIQADPQFATAINVAGSGPTFADLHPLNVAWQTQKGTNVGWVNDFDDAAVAPFAGEILRSVTAILVFAPNAVVKDVAASFLKAYNDARSGLTTGDRGPELDRIVALSAAAATGDVTDTVSQPEIGNAALQVALKALSTAAPKSLKNIDKCKPSFKVYAGGSSNGLPRFRFKCSDNIYEIKAARTDGWDASSGGNVEIGLENNAKRVVTNARALAAPQAGEFFVANGLLGQSWAGPWNYFVHERIGDPFNLDNLTAAQAQALGTVIGGLAGAGHRRAGAAPLTAAALTSLESFVPTASAELGQEMRALQQSLPDCL